MALTKSQRYLFCMEVEPFGIRKALVLIKEAAGILVLLAVAFAVGMATLLLYLPVSDWLSELHGKMGWTVILQLFVICIGAFIITHIIAAVTAIFSIFNIVDVSENYQVALIRPLLFIAPFVIYFVANGDGPVAAPIIYTYFVFRATYFDDDLVFENRLSYAAQSKRDAREFKSIESAIACIENQTDLAAIAFESVDRKIARVAIDHMKNQSDLAAVACTIEDRLNVYAALFKIMDRAVLLNLAENASEVEIRHYACKRLGHAFEHNRACCSRCGVTPDNRSHDWIDNICQRCGTERRIQTRDVWVPRASIDEGHWDSYDGIEQVCVSEEEEVYTYRSKTEREAAASERSNEVASDGSQ